MVQNDFQICFHGRKKNILSNFLKIESEHIKKFFLAELDFSLRQCKNCIIKGMIASFCILLTSVPQNPPTHTKHFLAEN